MRFKFSYVSSSSPGPQIWLDNLLEYWGYALWCPEQEPWTVCPTCGYEQPGSKESLKYNVKHKYRCGNNSKNTI